ncbi:hypothetical protein BpHYR1_006053 [Brachionus plicatilis]|uniref:Uncharacterized protein n=1 Tax=Brachionus plicatilis TaxID=10195 RepID=A0A3M7PIE2_BRAPC|nr:hypothetical protein BpHYR1_006053 [Brachionus plicatilis]
MSEANVKYQISEIHNKYKSCISIFDPILNHQCKIIESVVEKYIKLEHSFVNEIRVKIVTEDFLARKINTKGNIFSITNGRFGLEIKKDKINYICVPSFSYIFQNKIDDNFLITSNHIVFNI